MCQLYSEFNGENTGHFSFFSGRGRKFSKYGGDCFVDIYPLYIHTFSNLFILNRLKITPSPRFSENAGNGLP